MTAVKSFKGRRVLVTGGAGMLGSTLAQRLVELGSDVTVLDAMFPQYGGNAFNLAEIQNSIRFVQGDIRDATLMLQCTADVEYVFNLAAQVSHIDSNVDLLADLDVNCRGQINLLEACKMTGAHQTVVFASSRFVYGRVEYNPVDEKHPLNCLSVYGIHKLAGEKYHRFFYERYGLPTVSLRIANPYGPRQQMKHSKYGIVNWFIRLALEGRPLTVYGEGFQKRDYVYVEDIVEACSAAALSEKTSGQVYNVGSGQGVRFRDMADLIAKVIPGTSVVETETAIARAKAKYPEACLFVADPMARLADALETLGLTTKPGVVYTKDVVHHQTRPLEFVSELLGAASEAVIMRVRTRDVGATVADPELSCQYHYQGWMPYIVVNLQELIDHIKAGAPGAEIVVYRHHEILGGRHNRFLPKECYLPQTGTAETAVGVFRTTANPGRVLLEDRRDRDIRYSLDYRLKTYARRTLGRVLGR